MNPSRRLRNDFDREADRMSVRAPLHVRRIVEKADAEWTIRQRRWAPPPGEATERPHAHEEEQRDGPRSTPHACQASHVDRQCTDRCSATIRTGPSSPDGSSGESAL